MDIVLKENENNSLQVIFDGKLTIYSVHEARDCFLSVFKNYSSAVLDLSSVSDVDTAGFQIILCALRDFKKAGKPVCITENSKAVIDIFNKYGEKIQVQGK